MATSYDVAVVGGGLLGSALAFGLAREGQRVVVLDEGDAVKRASRANFALVWVQSKGLGMPAYMGWSVRASNQWSRLADEIKGQTGLDVAYQRPGGFQMALGEKELETRALAMQRLHNQAGAAHYPYEILAHAQVKKLIPAIGDEVSGASYCPLDGHVNSLRLFRAFHLAFKDMQVDYRPEQPVSDIRLSGGTFILTAPGGAVSAGKVVLAAGNANQTLAPMVGLSAPMGPTRGQILVTERVQPFLHYPTTTIRQTDEGTVMLGDSREEDTDDRVQNPAINTVIADRARRIFPCLGGLNVVRGWSGIRVMPQDGFPIYDQSQSHPGAFVACCHSGVTLASNHAFDVAPMIARGALDAAMLGAFSASRFAEPGERRNLSNY